MIFNFFRKLFSFFFEKSSDTKGVTINPGQKKTFELNYTFDGIDLDFPKNPVTGQTHKYDGFYIEFEDDMGHKYTKEFSQEFVFIGGSKWVQAQGQENIKIKIGGECESV